MVTARVIARDILSRASDGLSFAYPVYPADPEEAAHLNYSLWRDPAFAMFVDPAHRRHVSAR